MTEASLLHEKQMTQNEAAIMEMCKGLGQS